MTPPADTEVVHRRRRNGYSCPWHPLQFLAWGFIILFTVSHYGFTVYYIPGYWRVILFVVPGIVIIVYAVSTVVATAIDPAEPGVREKHFNKRRRKAFDRSAHKHVIENQHCHICETMVSDTAKHCRVCDKCVVDFDHHCIWLNTCVGARNYRWFFTTLVSALTGVVLLFLLNLALFILFFADRGSLRYDCAHPSNLTAACNDTLRVFSAAIPDPVFPTLTAVMAFLGAIAILLIGHLTTFHLYLIYRGISTYDYIIEQREKDERNAALNPAPPSRCSSCAKPKENRVSPASEDIDWADDHGDRMSIASCTFGPTPIPSYHSSQVSVYDNRTDEQKLDRTPYGHRPARKLVALPSDMFNSEIDEADWSPSPSPEAAMAETSFGPEFFQSDKAVNESSFQADDTNDTLLSLPVVGTHDEEDFPSAQEKQMDIINQAAMGEGSSCRILTGNSEEELNKPPLLSGGEEPKTLASSSQHSSHETVPLLKDPSTLLHHSPDDCQQIPAHSPLPSNRVHVASSFFSTSNASSTNSNSLQEIPLHSVFPDTSSVLDANRSLSPITKKVLISFEDADLESPRLGQQMHMRPLPPIGGGAPSKGHAKTPPLLEEPKDNN